MTHQHELLAGAELYSIENGHSPTGQRENHKRVSECAEDHNEHPLPKRSFSVSLLLVIDCFLETTEGHSDWLCSGKHSTCTQLPETTPQALS